MKIEVEMNSPIFLNFLWLVPIATWLITQKYAAPKRTTIRGVSFGLIVSPASLGLYSLYFVGPITAILGMIGLVMSLLHGSAGYQAAAALDLIPSHTVLNSGANLSIEVINALFWAVVYGFVGFSYGCFKNKKSSSG